MTARVIKILHSWHYYLDFRLETTGEHSQMQGILFTTLLQTVDECMILNEQIGGRRCHFSVKNKNGY